MLSRDVQVGSTYRCRVGDRIALVSVVSDRGGAGRRYSCRTQDTGRMIRASAAKLRPIPGSDLDTAERSRKAAAAAKRGPVPGVIGRVGPSPVVELSQPNRDTIRRIVDGVHVAEPFAQVARRVRARIGSMVTWNTIPRELRRGILHAAAQRHAEGRRLYRIAMRHDPLPSPRMVAESVGIACGLGPMPR
jgi:hypothetical protein